MQRARIAEGELSLRGCPIADCAPDVLQATLQEEQRERMEMTAELEAAQRELADMELQHEAFDQVSKSLESTEAALKKEIDARSAFEADLRAQNEALESEREMREAIEAELRSKCKGLADTKAKLASKCEDRQSSFEAGCGAGAPIRGGGESRVDDRSFAERARHARGARA